MLGDLFDSPWKILIIAVVILVLFGSRKLPEAARSLGRSMRILKTEIHELHDEDNGAQGAQQGQQGQWQPQPVAPQLDAPAPAAAPGVQYTAPPAAAPAPAVQYAAPPAAAQPSVPYTPAAGFPGAPAAPPASVPVPEVQQDTTRPA
jgi:sec-independent protein translocase protein TatA